jgi:hypothetical protein
MDILHSLHGRKIGLGPNDELILAGSRIVFNGGSAAFAAAGSTLTLTADDQGKTVLLNTATGSVVTLPPATGSGASFKFVVSVLATSNSHVVKVANASDTMIGGVTIADTDTAGAASSFFAGATGDTITLNRTTTGSVSLGEWIEVTDVAANKWHVAGMLSGTGTVATPFSATV